MALCPLRNCLLRLVKREVRCQGPDVLGRIGVPQHHFDLPAGLFQARCKPGVRQGVLKNLRCVVQVIEGLEKWDDVKHRVRSGILGEGVHGRQIIRRLCEGNDVAPSTTQPIAALQLCDSAENLKNLFGFGTELLAGFKCRQSAGMDRRVLAHLKLRQVETKGFNLPDQPLQTAVSLPVRTRQQQRILNHCQLTQQLFRVRISQVSVAGTCRRNPPGYQRQHLLVRLTRCANRGVGRSVLVRCRHLLPKVNEGVRRRSFLRIQSDGACDALGRSLKAAQDVVRCDGHRLLGDRGRHERIAVTITPNPGSQTHEGRHDRLLPPRGLTLQGVVDIAVDAGNGGVKGFVKDRHDRADLIYGSRLSGADGGCAPQGVNLFHEAAGDAPLGGHIGLNYRAFSQQFREAANTRRNGTTPRLCWVGCENRVETQVLEAGTGLILTDLFREFGEGFGEGVGIALNLRTPLLNQAHALQLFCKVDEVEVDSEGPGHLVRSLHRE